MLHLLIELRILILAYFGEVCYSISRWYSGGFPNILFFTYQKEVSDGQSYFGDIFVALDQFYADGNSVTALVDVQLY